MQEGEPAGTSRTHPCGSAASATWPSGSCPICRGGEGAGPVRVGNGAWSQRQLAVYAELLGAAQRLVEQLGELDGATRRFLVVAADR